MNPESHNLPHQSKRLFLTDGGLETTLIFHEGLDLPHFAACDLLRSDDGTEQLRRYYRTYASIARKNNVGFVLESVTWRANPDWCDALGYSKETFVEINTKSIQLCEEIKTEFQSDSTPIVISGCIGPRHDGYKADRHMTSTEAATYHIDQIKVFRKSGVDMVTALTMATVHEAVGVVRAAQVFGLPVVISFTVETDGCIPSGETLQQSILSVDAATNNGPAYYMINCAHPSHIEKALTGQEPWQQRVGGLRANASSKSHAELDEAVELDDGNPAELGKQYRSLLESLPQIKVLGGCCGTDHRHLEQILLACEGYYNSTGD